MSLSAAAFVGLWNHEGWSDVAVIPVRGDVPTVGPGLTKRPDGTPVQAGDTVKPIEAANRSLAHIQASESRIKQCVTAPLSQVEYDLMVKFAYQFGEGALCRSSMVREANAGNYLASCEAYKRYRYIHAGKPDQYDCSTMVDGRRNQVCWGVWERSLKNYEACAAAQ